MLIAACGAGGTGKTTTMQALAAATGLPFIPSASRAVFARRGLKEADQNKMTPHEQWELQQEIFAAREELEARTGIGSGDVKAAHVGKVCSNSPLTFGPKLTADDDRRLAFFCPLHVKVFLVPRCLLCGF